MVPSLVVGNHLLTGLLVVANHYKGEALGMVTSTVPPSVGSPHYKKRLSTKESHQLIGHRKAEASVWAALELEQYLGLHARQHCRA